MAAAGDGVNVDQEREHGALSFTGRALSRRFEHREVVIETGGSLTCCAPTWAGAFVVV
jgi:hypothetical protein